MSTQFLAWFTQFLIIAKQYWPYYLCVWCCCSAQVWTMPPDQLDQSSLSEIAECEIVANSCSGGHTPHTSQSGVTRHWRELVKKIYWEIVTFCSSIIAMHSDVTAFAARIPCLHLSVLKMTVCILSPVQFQSNFLQWQWQLPKSYHYVAFCCCCCILSVAGFLCPSVVVLNVAPVSGDGDTMTIIQRRWPDQTTGTTGTIGDHMGPHGSTWDLVHRGDHMGPSCKFHYQHCTCDTWQLTPNRWSPDSWIK